MPAIPKIPETATEYQSIVKYLQSKTISETIQKNPIAKSNFAHRCKKFEVDENKILYIPAVIKDGIIKSEKRRVIPKYNEELRALIFTHFHDQANYHSYHKTFSAISEKHIGIMQEEAQA